MRRRGIALWLTLSIACLGVACSLEDGGTLIAEGTDGSISKDGAVDGATLDDGSPPADAGDTDSGPTDSGADVVIGPTFLCGATPVTSCQTSCAGFPNNCPVNGMCVADCTVGCFDGATFDVRYCDACFSDGGAAISVCEPADPTAVASCLTGFSRCPCPTSEADCPGPYQTCDNNMCFECGEPDAGNNGGDCTGGTGGKHCDTGGNTADHLRCH